MDRVGCYLTSTSTHWRKGGGAVQRILCVSVCAFVENRPAGLTTSSDCLTAKSGVQSLVHERNILKVKIQALILNSLGVKVCTGIA